eukprot:CAMPEP_0194544126 /NCGR_PEP_ID=MMETSP0253-20130528/86968_1 /TAXON_ID=2966 /ORGANISM="Noctiluca scintillans" /LENGTH=41 /DNA_ID= /DNA_START= /DNA_END= /DNA_ORIENTATION=
MSHELALCSQPLVTRVHQGVNIGLSVCGAKILCYLVLQQQT